ncbi:unnamed protein product, partial [Meganyctiphanes norvegica]
MDHAIAKAMYGLQMNRSQGRPCSTPIESVETSVAQRSREEYKRVFHNNMAPKDMVFLFLSFLLLNLKMIVIMIIEFVRMFIPTEEKSIKGKLILVTGAGQNLGRELSLQLARLGARLVLWDINGGENEETASMIRKEGGEATAFVCDVSDQHAVAATGARVRREIGNPNLVFNNAGTYEFKPFLKHTPQEIQRMVNVNLMGNLWVTREFIDHMIQHNEGHLISISSVLGFIGRSQVVPYCASKWGVKGMTEALAEEMRLERRSGITVTAVHPFLIDNVDDVKPDLKFPWLFEILKAPDAAARIIRGVRQNQEEIFLPEKLKPLMICSKILPRKIRRLTGDWMEN